MWEVDDVESWACHICPAVQLELPAWTRPLRRRSVHVDMRCSQQTAAAAERARCHPDHEHVRDQHQVLDLHRGVWLTTAEQIQLSDLSKWWTAFKTFLKNSVNEGKYSVITIPSVAPTQALNLVMFLLDFCEIDKRSLVRIDVYPCSVAWEGLHKQATGCYPPRTRLNNACGNSELYQLPRLHWQIQFTDGDQSIWHGG